MLEHAAYLLSSNLGDRYASTMAKVLAETDPGRRAVMSLLQRKSPNGHFSVCFGLNDALYWLENYGFADGSPALETAQGLSNKSGSPMFTPGDIQALQQPPEFTVWAIPPGAIIPPGMTQLLIEGPLAHDLMLEVPLIQSVAYATEVATNAFSVVRAAAGIPVHEFAGRRCVNPIAAALATEAALMVGFAGTSNVPAARILGKEPVGTMAHALIMSEINDCPEDAEETAFANFARVHPDSFVALIDTYDPMAGLRNAIAVSEETEVPLLAIRIDSGNLAELAREARRVLNEHHMENTKIMLTGGLNPGSIQELVLQIGDLGIVLAVGDYLAYHDPGLGTVYKIAEVASPESGGDWHGSAKNAPGKFSLPFAHMPYVLVDKDGMVIAYMLDVFPGNLNGGISIDQMVVPKCAPASLVDIHTREVVEIPPSLTAIPMMKQYLLNGKRVTPAPSFADKCNTFDLWKEHMSPETLQPGGQKRLPFGLSPEYAARITDYERKRHLGS